MMKRPSRGYGIYLENLPLAYWEKLKGIKQEHGLSTRQMLALGIRTTIALAMADWDSLLQHVEVVKKEVSSKPGRPRKSSQSR